MRICLWDIFIYLFICVCLESDPLPHVDQILALRTRRNCPDESLNYYTFFPNKSFFVFLKVGETFCTKSHLGGGRGGTNLYLSRLKNSLETFYPQGGLHVGESVGAVREQQ